MSQPTGAPTTQTTHRIGVKCQWVNLLAISCDRLGVQTHDRWRRNAMRYVFPSSGRSINWFSDFTLISRKSTIWIMFYHFSRKVNLNFFRAANPFRFRFYISQSFECSINGIRVKFRAAEWKERVHNVRSPGKRDHFQITMYFFNCPNLCLAVLVLSCSAGALSFWYDNHGTCMCLCVCLFSLLLYGNIYTWDSSDYYQ